MSNKSVSNHSYTSSRTLVVLLLQHHLAAWQAALQQPLQDLPIEGEKNWLPTGENASILPQSLADLDERLASRLPLVLVYDAASQPMLEGALAQLVTQLKGRPWQVLCYEQLQARVGSAPHHADLPSRDWLAQHLLPLLLASDDVNEREHIQAATRELHTTLSEQMQAERQKLERENVRLKNRLSALQTIEAEHLITYLPALFARVFSLVSGRDLALLTGRVEPYNLPNPYPEPCPKTLHVLQRDFIALPREIQQQIVDFIAKMPQRGELEPRFELRELILDLEKESPHGRR
ncbi:MAG: hypothetical protein ACRC6D_08610 [Aeromonas sp.]